ncbi:MAG TPA: RodZ domain-containing protein [Methylomirabilota bacterium]|nr:RodZ domain-containing protein [Methylomirabilota bacterium]
MEQAEAARSLGTYLRSLREIKGGSLEEMARSTRVGVRHLEALENNNLAELPAPVFVRGFIRAYCSFLNEPADTALARYRELLGERESAEIGGAPPSRQAESWRSSPVLISLALLAAFGIGLLALNGILRRPPKAPVPVVTAPAPAEAPSPIAAAGTPAEGRPGLVAGAPPASTAAATPPESAGVPAGAQHRLVVKAVEATWIRVQTDDGRVAEELLPPGATREWTSTKRFVLTIGNAGGIEIELNGRVLAPLGARGAVIQRLELPQGGS